MKLTSNLSYPGASLFFAPCMNVILLLLGYFLINSNLVVRPGMEIVLPASSATLRPFLSGVTVTVTGATDVEYRVNDEPVEIADLRDKLTQIRKNSAFLLIRADEDTPLNWVVRIQDIALNLGFETALATRRVLPAP